MLYKGASLLKLYLQKCFIILNGKSNDNSIILAYGNFSHC